MAFGANGPVLLNPGFAPGGDLGRPIVAPALAAVEAQVEAFRDGAGGAADIMLDANFGCTPEGFACIAGRIQRFGDQWKSILAE
jgi:galactonate dehydratase